MCTVECSFYGAWSKERGFKRKKKANVSISMYQLDAQLEFTSSSSISNKRQLIDFGKKHSRVATTTLCACITRRVIFFSLSFAQFFFHLTSYWTVYLSHKAFQTLKTPYETKLLRLTMIHLLQTFSICRDVA